MESLRGKVVLIDFWTYSCINCIRTLPFLRRMVRPLRRRRAWSSWGCIPRSSSSRSSTTTWCRPPRDEMVAWPVVQDNEFSVWRSYSNRYWPAKYLIDQHGVIPLPSLSEKAEYAETEEMNSESLLAGR